MRIQLNGQDREVPLAATLDALIAALDLKADRIAVELNQEIVSRSRWAHTPVHDGDRLEIVHFVGGGF
jgi:thiamine biosynthesis protein ThiS